MWWTGSSIMWKGSQIAEKPVNTPATCWRPATSDTLSTRSPSLNSVTTSLETSVAVSGSALSVTFSVGCYCGSLNLFFFFYLPQTWPTCLSMTMMVPVGVLQIRTHSPLCPIPGQPPGPWLCPTSSLFHTHMNSHSPSMVDQALAVQEASTVVSAVRSSPAYSTRIEELSVGVSRKHTHKYSNIPSKILYQTLTPCRFKKCLCKVFFLDKEQQQ